LGERSFMERHGTRLAMHDLVAHVVRSDLSYRAPTLTNHLRRRIADHAYANAVIRRQPISLELAHLVEAPAIRWGFSEGFRTHRLDDVRPDDHMAMHDALCARGDQEQWARVEPYVATAPARLTILRDARDRLVGFTTTVSPATRPTCTANDPVLAPWLADALRRDDGVATVLWQSATCLDGEADARAQGLLGLAGFLRCGLSRVRYCYLPIAPNSQGALAFSAAVGAVHHPHLDFEDSNGITECHVADFGPAGALGALLAVVHAETGAENPTTLDEPRARRSPGPVARVVGQRTVVTSPSATPTDGSARAVVDLPGPLRDVVHDAPRHFLDDAMLARLPRLTRTTAGLVDGQPPELPGTGTDDKTPSTTAKRAEAVRAIVLDALADSFSPSASDQRLREAIERGYLDPAANHDSVARTRFISRATYYRRLRSAVDRLTETFLESTSAQPAPTNH